MPFAFSLLLVAIAAEVLATALLPRTDGFTHLGWSVAVLGGYAVAIWLLALVVQRIPVSVTYAVWAGLGTASVAVIGMTVLGEQVTPLKVLALTMIVAGVVLLNLQGAAH